MRLDEDQQLLINERDISIDNINCYREFEIFLPGIEDLGIKPPSLRVYIPIIKNFPLSTYSKHLFTSYGYSESDSEYYYNLIRVHLTLGSIISLKSGKNPYWNQSFMMFRDSTLLYRKTFNEDLKDLMTKKSIRENIKGMSEVEKNNAKEEIKSKIIQNSDTYSKDDFLIFLRKAIYEKLEPVELTPQGFESYKADIINRIKEFSAIFVTNLKNNKTQKEILKQLKEIITHEYSDFVRTPVIDNILKRINVILSTVKWYESDTGATIFIDPLVEYPSFKDETNAILEELKDELYKFQVSKKTGLKEKVGEWLGIINIFQTHPEVADQSLSWIKNEFSRKTNALRRISLEGKLYYNRLISLFNKKSLTLIQQNESLSKYESRLFILMNMEHKFCDFHIISLEPIFLNYLKFSKTGAITFLFANIFRMDTILKDHFYSDIIGWLKFFPLWKHLIRDEDLHDKRIKRKSEKEQFLIPNQIVNGQDDNKVDFYHYSERENNADEEETGEMIQNPSDNIGNQEQVSKIILILKKYGKPVHVEVIEHLLVNKNLGLLTRKKGHSKQYYNKIKKEANNIIRDHYNEFINTY